MYDACDLKGPIRVDLITEFNRLLKSKKTKNTRIRKKKLKLLIQFYKSNYKKYLYYYDRHKFGNTYYNTKAKVLFKKKFNSFINRAFEKRISVVTCNQKKLFFNLRKQDSHFNTIDKSADT